MTEFEPRCRAITGTLVQEAISQRYVEIMQHLAMPLAVQCQCAFLGWSQSLHGRLIAWMQRNQEANLRKDQQASAEVAREFEAIVNEQIDQRQQSGAGPETDLTASLMHAQVHGRPLRKEEIASILRTWTAGEIGTLASSVGILAAFLAKHPSIQDLLRAQPEAIPSAIEEILRIHGPLAGNRRLTTAPAEIGGRKLEAGAKVFLMWTAANRDEDAFEDAAEFRLDRDPAQSLLWGAGIHVCPGAPLAQLELRVFLEDLLARTSAILAPAGATPSNAVYPASGFATLPLHLEAR